MVKELILKTKQNYNGDEGYEYKLHPTYPANFISIFGRCYNIKNVITMLQRGAEALQYVGEKPTKNLINKILKMPKVKIKNFNEIISLITLDRVLMDQELTDLIVSDFDPNIKIKKIKIIKTGVVISEIEEVANDVYSKSLKEIIKFLIDNYKIYEDNEYKEFKKKIKEEFLNKIIEKVNGDILESFNVDNEKLKDFYLR